jgi:23S rRNA-/tRNA-specific pseudouridylate synthase
MSVVLLLLHPQLDRNTAFCRRWFVSYSHAWMPRPNYHHHQKQRGLIAPRGRANGDDDAGGRMMMHLGVWRMKESFSLLFVGPSRRLSSLSSSTSPSASRLQTVENGTIPSNAATAPTSVPSAWKITTAPFSVYASHVEIESYEDHDNHGGINRTTLAVASNLVDTLTVEDVIEHVIEQQQQKLNANKRTRREPWLSPLELLQLGGIWYLPADEYRHQRRQSNNNKKHGDEDWKVKPRRLTAEDCHLSVQLGDYLRVHHTLRRFETVHNYQWDLPVGSNRSSTGSTTATIFTNPNNTMKHNVPSRHRRGLVVARNTTSGFLVIDKPPLVPVHATVDNAVENVVYQIQHAPLPPLRYVSTTHRVDINTSGLLVVATTKSFAAYFATLLRRKTAHQIQQWQRKPQHQPTQISSTNDTHVTSNDKQIDANGRPNRSSSSNIFKGYKCLVCVVESPTSIQQQEQQKRDTEPSSPWSVERAVTELQNYATHQALIRHYLEPSQRVPKRFAEAPPDTASERLQRKQHALNEAQDEDNDNEKENEKDWLECLLQIRAVHGVYMLDNNGVGAPVVPTTGGNDEDNETNDKEARRQQQQQQQQALLQSLWPSPHIARPPSEIRAVVEIEVHLLTGRTHQIRGQLSILGYPLVGDEQYGGARSISMEQEEPHEYPSGPPEEEKERAMDQIQSSRQTSPPQLLALQCCELAFWDPDYVEDKPYRTPQHQQARERRNSRNNNNPNNGDDAATAMPQPQNLNPVKGVISSRWNHYRLDEAWWTPLLTQYRSYPP